MHQSTSRPVRRSAVLTAALLLGTLMQGTCVMRARDAVIQGAQLVVLDLFNPANFIVVGTDGAENGNQATTGDGTAAGS